MAPFHPNVINEQKLSGERDYPFSDSFRSNSDGNRFPDHCPHLFDDHENDLYVHEYMSTVCEFLHTNELPSRSMYQELECYDGSWKHC